MPAFRKRQLVLDSETGRVGRVERVARKYVLVEFENAFEFMTSQVGFTKATAASRLVKRKPGQRQFPETVQTKQSKEQESC